MFSKGEDPPSQEDIEYYGLLNACERTNGEFALYSLKGRFAARGRIGTSPLYWNSRTRCNFSFVPSDDSPDDFPPGHLYSGNRLVCWDHMYYDKPQSDPAASERIPKLIREITEELESKVDAILIGPDMEGSVLISDYCSMSPPPVLNEWDARYLRENTEYRKFMCSLGYDDLFEPGTRQRNLYPIVREFAKYGLELYSPFCDFRIVDYVMDMTLPEERKNLLQFVEDEAL
jgi:hypothetical protein